ncbi:MAG: asparagine synthase (glutamine-hydrolyzing), partial [Candidatus Bipolaricaulota bacterium]
MRDSLSHRGPDDCGSWMSGDRCVGLGNRRLAVIDLSPAARQPMVNDSETVAVVHNGEIYNYLELRRDLQELGHAFHSDSDTEVLLAAYRQWGRSCLGRLNDMFAFAIWDSKTRELFAARDRFGEKPFYYVQLSGRGLLFASEVKALFASRGISPEPEQRSIYRFLAHREIDVGEATLFSGVRALPPAHALVYAPEEDRLEMWRYWDLDPDHRISLPNDVEYAEHFLELLTDAVRLRLRSDVPVGSSLSGGLDSSTIVGLVSREVERGNQKTFSARFHDPLLDEGNHIQRVVAHTGVRDCMTWPDPERIPEEMPTITWHQEHPFFSTSIYAQWNVMRLARDENVTVLLDGQGADEALAGYHTYYGPYFRGLLQACRVGRLTKDFLDYVSVHGTGVLPVVLFSLLPDCMRHSVRKRVRPLALASDWERQWIHRNREEQHNPFRDPLHRALYETLTRTMLPALLRYADRNSMAFSREIRLPFLDHRLVEFLFAIP